MAHKPHTKWRPGPGEYYSPGETDYPLQEVRSWFLSRIEKREKAQKVLFDLRDAVWPEYRVALSGVASGWNPMPLSRLKMHRSLDHLLRSWAARWNLCRQGKGEWTLQTALETLAMWETWPRGAEIPQFARPGAGGSALFSDPLPFAFEHPGWDPEFSTRKNFTWEITAAFRMRLREYAERVEAVAEERGAKRSPRPDEIARDVEWLVRVYIEGETAESIEREHYTGKSTVRQAINRLRKRIELPPLK